MIQFFNEEFGYPYPWVKYDQLSFRISPVVQKAPRRL